MGKWRISYDHDRCVLPSGKWDLRYVTEDGAEFYLECFRTQWLAMNFLERIQDMLKAFADDEFPWCPFCGFLNYPASLHIERCEQNHLSM